MAMSLYDTRREAYPDDVPAIRSRVLNVFRTHAENGLTADQAAERLGLSILTVRPRVTELVQMAKLEKTEATRRNASGKSARVLRPHLPEQPGLFE